MKNPIRIAAITLAPLVFPSLHAATLTWDGGGADNNWGTAENWNPDSALDNGNTLTFDGTTSLTSNNEATRILADNSIIFASGAGAFDLTGAALRAGSVTNSSSVMQTISLSLRYNGTRSIDTGTAGITLASMPLSTSSTSVRTVNVSGAGDLVLSGGGGARILFNVTEGGLVVSGNLGTAMSATINNGATLSGGGTIGGDLVLNSGAILDVNFGDLLTVAGAATLNDFGFSSITGWDASSAADGTYTLVDGITSLTLNGSTPTSSNPFQFSATKFGYFEAGSLQAVIYTVPEPSIALLGGLGLLGLVRRRRA